jgi:NADH-quinone oxidoreductase subunit G
VRGAITQGRAPAAPEHGAIGTLRLAAEGKLDLLILLGADPIGDCPDADLARRALAGGGRILAIDTFLTASSLQADVVLPAAAFAEQDGTTTGLDGRITTVAQKVTPHGTSRPDWMIAAELASILGHDLGFDSVGAVTAAITAAGQRSFGALAALATGDNPRNSYEYRLVVSRTLYDGAVGTAMSPSLAGLAPGTAAHLHPLDLDTVGVPAGTEVQLVGHKRTVVLPLVADERVARGTIWAAFNQDGANICDLVDAAADVTDVRIARIS